MKKKKTERRVKIHTATFKGYLDELPKAEQEKVLNKFKQNNENELQQ